jgi:hypothetical protein
MTFSGGTLQKRLIFRLTSGGMGRSERQISRSGWMPMVRNAITLCWVGFVFSSPAVRM